MGFGLIDDEIIDDIQKMMIYKKDWHFASFFIEIMN
jgi:hypothetical protein